MHLKGDQQNIKSKSIDIKEIDQFDAFRKIISYTPKIGDYYLSIFRNDDSHPGCRYEMHKGILYFIDNKGYDNKLAFHILQVIQILHQTDVYGAYEILRKNNFGVNKTHYIAVNKKIDIRIVPEKWTEDNIFTKIGKIPIEYLNNQPAYSVYEYFCNTKKDSRIKKNQIYDPSINETIAYHFPSNNIKLYWPNVSNGKLKFYANISNDDIFGEHRYHEYVGEDLFIVKSGKDDFLVNYHLGINTLGTQSENISFSSKFLSLCEPFSNLYIWYDNDETGKKYADIRAKELKEFFPDKNIFILVIPKNQKNAKDPFDILKNNWDLVEMFDLIFSNKKEII